MLDNSNEDIWLPRNILRRTNWLYRVDALRNHNIREMSVLWEVSVLCLEYCKINLAYVHDLFYIISGNIDEDYRDTLEKMSTLLIELLQLIMSEGYCYFLDFLHIAYYPASNRHHQFPPIKYTLIDELTDHNARELTGLSINQLKRLSIQLRLPSHFRWRVRY